MSPSIVRGAFPYLNGHCGDLCKMHASEGTFRPPVHYINVK